MNTTTSTKATATPDCIESYRVWALTTKGPRFIGRYFTVEEMWAARGAYCKRHPRFGRTFQVDYEFKK